MGLMDVIRRWFGGGAKPVVREVACLEAGSAGSGERESGDVVKEVVDVSGGPMREKGRRRALRDKRLLPKEKRRRLWGEKRKKVMEAEEAGRLFSGTLRNRDRKIRDLLADVEQLGRLGLAVWRTEEEVAEALGVSVKTLRHYSIHREKERCRHYVAFTIPKRSGGERMILAPKRKLKAMQRKLNELLVSKLPVSEFAHGFRAGRSVRSNAEPHVGKGVVIRVDLKDFFPSVHFGRVRGLLVGYGYGYAVATVIAVLMTEAERQPVEVEGAVYQVPVGPRYCVQGAPTSPGICNAVLRRLDLRLAGFARKYGLSYTRYADDLIFSGETAERVGGVLKAVGRIVREEGFAVKREKTRVSRAGGRQVVTGVTVNEVLGLSRKERRVLRAALHRQGGKAEAELPAELRGKLAYLKMLNPEQHRRLLGKRESVSG